METLLGYTRKGLEWAGNKHPMHLFVSYISFIPITAVHINALASWSKIRVVICNFKFCWFIIKVIYSNKVFCGIVLHFRPHVLVNLSELYLNRVSFALLPIRLHLDQRHLDFCTKFFSSQFGVGQGTLLEENLNLSSRSSLSSTPSVSSNLTDSPTEPLLPFFQVREIIVHAIIMYPTHFRQSWQYFFGLCTFLLKENVLTVSLVSLNLQYMS